MSNYNSNVESAYIIRIKNHKTSEKLAKRCYNSCKLLDMPVQCWDAVDGTSGTIIIPNNIKNQSYIKWPKVYNKLLSNSAIATFLSHYSLWCHCIEIDKPIVILEDDVIVVKKFEHHKYNKAIVYLGNLENNNPTVYYGLGEQTQWFIRRLHAYSIDPLVARQLVSQVITQGITCPCDQFIRYDYYTIIQEDIYAYDKETSEEMRRISYKNINYKERGIIPSWYE
jgi:hypothetical protein